MRVYLLKSIHLLCKIAILALFAIDSDLAYAFVPTSCTLSSVSHEATSTLTVKHMSTL